MPLANTPWSDEKVEELRRLWAAGLSGTDIAKALGEEFSRCAVLGKVMRLKLPQRKSAESKPGPPLAARGFWRRPVFRAPRKNPSRRPQEAKPVLQETLIPFSPRPR